MTTNLTSKRPRIELTPELVRCLSAKLARINYARALRTERPLSMIAFVRDRLMNGGEPLPPIVPGLDALAIERDEPLPPVESDLTLDVAE